MGTLWTDFNEMGVWNNGKFIFFNLKILKSIMVTNGHWPFKIVKYIKDARCKSNPH